MQYLLLIYQNEAQAGAASPAQMAAMHQEYGAFTGAFSQTFSTTVASGIYTLKIIHGSNTYYTRIIVKH